MLSSDNPERPEIMDWIPIVFVTFKVLVLATGAFYAIKWHHLRAQREKKTDKRAAVRAGAKVAAVFVLALLGVGLFTVVTSRMLGLDLTLP